MIFVNPNVSNRMLCHIYLDGDSGDLLCGREHELEGAGGRLHPPLGLQPKEIIWWTRRTLVKSHNIAHVTNLASLHFLLFGRICNFFHKILFIISVISNVFFS